MSRINTNVQSLIAQRVLGQNNTGLNTALERLSTGLRITRAKDDPAGLIASENLRSEEKSLNQAIANADRADQVANIAEGGLQEVSSLLVELQGLITSSSSAAGLSQEEKEANQLQVDSILQTIDRISGATNFQGIKLLNGNFDYTTSGVSTANISDLRINSAKFNTSSLNVNVSVTQSAQTARAFIGGPAFGTLSLDLSSATAQFKVEIGGKLGSREFTFIEGTSITAISDAINQFSDVTGVIASAAAAGGGFTELSLKSTDVGKDQFVSVRVIDDGGTGSGGRVTTIGNTNTTAQTIDADLATNAVRALGQDVKGTINGVVANGVGDSLSLSSDFLDVKIKLSSTASQTLGQVAGSGGGNPTFAITGGGADFQLSSKVDINGRVSLGIGEVAARKLGKVGVGYLTSLASGQANNVVTGDVTDAQTVVAEAIKQVSVTRGRIGAFQKNVVSATIRSLSINIENTAAAQSSIRDADFASETANLTRSQILVSAATNVLGLANSQPQSALQLLG